MGNAIVHRGPDDSGDWTDGDMLLGMRRLSIIDLDGGHQPLFNETGSIALVCNGEIYNFRTLRRELEAKGHRFATGSDSEVAIHLYEELGIEFLTKLDGMFGLALFDVPRRRLIIARDPLGIKPVYLARRGASVAFASEAKSLLRLPWLSAQLNEQALPGYLSLGYVNGPESIFRGIEKLAPATALILEGGRQQLHKYWRLPAGQDHARSAPDWVAAVREGIQRAVRAQMVSDVPVGAFLSGGIDSSAVVAAMSRESGQPIRTYSIGFAGSSGSRLYNELPFARRIAEQFGTHHREIIVRPDVANLLPTLIWHLDEPMADAAFITTYLVSKFAREDVKVILSGVGGDELFGGYKRYLDGHYRTMYRRIPALLRTGLIEPIARRMPVDRHSRILNLMRLGKAFVLSDGLREDERYRSFMEIFGRKAMSDLLGADPAVGQDPLMEAFAGATGGDFVRRLMEVDLATQLPEDLLALTDRMSMAVSLECRVPLLDQQLVELAATMPSSFKIRGSELKSVLKMAMKGILPDEVLFRPKRGFGAPIGAWFRDDLSPLVGGLLSRKVVERRGLFQPDAVARLIREHENRRADHTDHLLALINLEIWSRIYLDGTSANEVTESLATGAAA